LSVPAFGIAMMASNSAVFATQTTPANSTTATTSPASAPAAPSPDPTLNFPADMYDGLIACKLAAHDKPAAEAAKVCFDQGSAYVDKAVAEVKSNGSVDRTACAYGMEASILTDVSYVLETDPVTKDKIGKQADDDLSALTSNHCDKDLLDRANKAYALGHPVPTKDS
jgi:hypothetical protein